MRATAWDRAHAGSDLPELPLLSTAPFSEQHAYFLSSVSRIAAITLENLSKLDSLRAENQRLRGEGKAEQTLVGRAGPCCGCGSSSGGWLRRIRRC